VERIPVQGHRYAEGVNKDQSSINEVKVYLKKGIDSNINETMPFCCIETDWLKKSMLKELNV